MKKTPNSHNKGTDILIGYLQSVDKKDVDDFESFCRENLSKNVIAKENKTTLQASIEWALPALFVIYLAKPFIDSFLKELGSEAGKSFYKYLSSLIKRQENKEAVWMNTHDLKAMTEQLERGIPEDEVVKSGNYSPVLSFDISFSKSHKVKIVIPFHVVNFSKNEIEYIVGEIPKIMNTENDLSKYLHESRVIIYGYDTEDKKWVMNPVKYSHKKNLP